MSLGGITMLKIIYETLGVLVLVLSVIIVLILKEQYDSRLRMKIRVIMTLIISVFFFLKIILGIILKLPVFDSIICLGLWAGSTIIGFLGLKEFGMKLNCLETGTDTEEITDIDAVTEVLTENNK